MSLPPVKQVKYELDGNYIVQLQPSPVDKIEFSYESGNPFVIKNGEIKYFLTSKKNDDIPIGCNYALLTAKKPRKKDFLEGKIKLTGWLKHPSFNNLNPDDIVQTWDNNFNFIKEDLNNNIYGLRPPQISALYSILGHVQHANERGIVVMPTGTGKTETMISTVIANKCRKVLVSVPSDSLRTQISNKFISLGLLREFGVVDASAKNPFVGIINHRMESDEALKEFLSKVNVVITTMDILSGSSNSQKSILSNEISHFFVDEAHHSEARTWKNLINYFDDNKVLLFTATPFRNDGKKLRGKFIYKFTLKQAQQEGYYKEIDFLPIREYDKQKADIKIANKAVDRLREDMAQGFDHIIMARCLSKNRAKEVFEYYKKHEDLSPVIVYTGVPGLKNKIEAIKKKLHKVVVCVNMLGEGFDLPELKIAAIHDERQSLPITLQFVGRFTRTAFTNLGKASFVTNIAYPPIKKELNNLYAQDADWNSLLPNVNEQATDREINFQSFLEGFNNLDNSSIPFQNINPALSTVVYKNSGSEWNPNNWREGIQNIDNYEHQFSSVNSAENTLVIILGKVAKVEWGDFDVVKNMDWSMVVVFWDYRPNKNLIFVHSSSKGISQDGLVDAVFDNPTNLITGMDVFKIFHEVKRLTLYNVGARKGVGKDISFQSFFGRGVQDGIKHLEQGTLIKNNIFGVGFKDGEKVSLGCSVKGKIWSYLRGNLNELVSWCKEIGNILENPNINPNTVLENTIIPVKIDKCPNTRPIMVDWHPEMYQYAENKYTVMIGGRTYDLSNSELIIIGVPNDETIRFGFICEDYTIEFDLVLGSTEIDGEKQFFHTINKNSAENPIITYGTKSIELKQFFHILTPTIWFADGSQLFQNNFAKPKSQPDKISLGSITPMDWTGVSLNKEAQGIVPYKKDSIQFHFIKKIKDDYDIIYDDDGSGEIADVIGINDFDDHINIHLFHLKFAKGGKTGNDIDNFYQVCGQAQKSLGWKYREGRFFFDHLLRRKVKSKTGNECSRIIKGTEKDLELLLNAAKWTKEMRFHIYIVQPSLIKDNASDDILLLLGNTHHYLHTVGNVELKVISNNQIKK